MTTDKNPNFTLTDEVSPLVETDFAEIEKRVLAGHIEKKTFKASDFVHPQITNAYLAQAMYTVLLSRSGQSMTPVNGKAPEPNKRAKTKAARKQRREQK